MLTKQLNEGEAPEIYKIRNVEMILDSGTIDQ